MDVNTDDFAMVRNWTFLFSKLSVWTKKQAYVVAYTSVYEEVNLFN
jgi:hypothetical protein